jgi:hypothetical protein
MININDNTAAHLPKFVKSSSGETPLQTGTPQLSLGRSKRRHTPEY